jgi:hypothetical protein
MRSASPRSDPRFKDFDDFDWDQWVAPVASLRSLTAIDLIQFKNMTGLERSRQLSLSFSYVDAGYLVADESPSDPSDFLVTSRAVRFRAICPIEADAYVDDGVAHEIHVLAKRLASRVGLRLVAEENDWSGGSAWATLLFVVPLHTQLNAVLAFNEQLRQLLEHNPRRLDQQNLWDLLACGLPDALIGCSESHWLEVKSEPYRLDDALHRLELGKDVSAIANSGGGILTIGFATRRREGVDTITQVRPVPQALVSPERYRTVLRTVLYPRLQGIEVVYVETASERGILALRIARQPGDALPTIVIGMPGVRRRQVEGAYWGIFRRQGDDAIPIAPAAVHAALRGGLL